MLNMLPKFELVPIMMYLRMLAKVRRPSSTPSCNTRKITPQQDDVGSLLGDVNGGIDRKAHVGRMQRGCIVDAVAEVTDDVLTRA